MVATALSKLNKYVQSERACEQMEPANLRWYSNQQISCWLIYANMIFKFNLVLSHWEQMAEN